MRPLLWVVVAPAIFGGTFFLTNAGMDYFVGPVEPSKAVGLATLSIEPAKMKSCEPVRIGTLTWDAARSGAKTVKIFVTANNKETPFATSTPVGKVDTGAWMGAGATFVLRDGANDRELTRSTVGTQQGACP